ncbi:MAG: imidazoleglycerol-phosphate dehydratase HisB [Synergistaceae bacterium]|jgi:imidazoleglycerol-phosphate dehydratase|nr:imidazoleglycerol-phosphate dehydratase HisB [Synergistaceae bacterium]
MRRAAELKRTTNETEITASFAVDGSGTYEISTGVGFFDHMLCHVARHGFFDLAVKAEGDLHVDCHHTIEDVGIALGRVISDALGNREGIARYGEATVPMEDALVLVALDISGRPFLAFDVEFTTPRLGDMDAEMVEEFFRALCLHMGLNLHMRAIAGKNNHHIAEAAFKAFGRAMDQATAIDPRVKGVLSTKGVF